MRPLPTPRTAKRRATKRADRELTYDLWHLGFADLMEHRGPRSFTVRTEVRLTLEPQRADMLLLHRKAARGQVRARVLRRLWPVLGKVTVLEYKSPVASSFRDGDLRRLFGYGVLYHTAHRAELRQRSDLTLALVLPAVTLTVRDEIALMGWTFVDLGRGYGRIDGAEYAIHVAAVDEVSEAEKDDFLRAFSRHELREGPAASWLRQWLKEDGVKQRRKQDMPGYDEVFEKLAATVRPEARLAGLDPAHTVLALPPEVLRGFTAEFILSLPADVQKEVKKRLRRARAAEPAARRT